MISLVPIAWKIIGGLVLILGLFGFGYEQGIKHGENEARKVALMQSKELLAATQDAVNKTAELQTKKDEAQDAAQKRQTLLVVANRNAVSTVDSLRDELNAYRASLPKIAIDACRRYADTASAVVESCSAEYRLMAEVAESRNSAQQTVMDAWPK